MESAESSNIILIVAVGCAAMTLLACFIIFFVVLYQKKVIIQKNEVASIKAKHEQELLKSTLEVEEKERERVAKNIHDDLGALISLLRLNNSRTTKNINNIKILTKISKENNIILNKTSESIRSISKKLASPTLAKMGYSYALKELTNSFNQTNEIKMTFFDSSPENNPIHLPPKKASHLFRASQEIINNIIKHDKAEEINVIISSDQKNRIIQFKHTGKGINNEQVEQLITQNKGLGLGSIQSRLNIIDAKIDYQTTTNSKASITITYHDDEQKN